MIDLLYGCAVLGTGGGGKIEHGFDIMKEDFEKGRTLKLAEPTRPKLFTRRWKRGFR